MNIYIKNMVSIRCIRFVESALEILAIDFIKIELGIIKTEQELSIKQLEDLNHILKKYDLEIIKDKVLVLVENIKVIICNKLDSLTVDENLKQTISETLDYDYQYLGKLFSKSQGITLHKFIVLKKVEKVKELLKINELNISEIANKLCYSSIAHLSYQFKKETGFSPTAYRKKEFQQGRIISLNQIKH